MLIIFVGIVYIIGGICGKTGDFNLTYEVITVDVNTGEVSEAEDAMHALFYTGAASSCNRIVVCGGALQHKVKNVCQLYTPTSNRCVCVFETLYSV